MKAEHAIIRILANPEKRIPEGGGVLVDSDHILTCVHVVDAVSVDEEVWFDFSHFPESAACKGEVIRRDEAADIAVVKILPDQELPSAAVPARFMTPAEDGFEKQAYICGFPENLEKGDWAYGRLVGETGAGWIQMDHDLTSKLVKPGFSGSPAWVDRKRWAAGLVVQRFTGAGESSAYVVPVRTLVRIFPNLSFASLEETGIRQESERKGIERKGELTPEKKPVSGSVDFSILHLSDFHFGTAEQAELWAEQLIQDLTGELKCDHLDALVVSGDIANVADPGEYEAAKLFFQHLVKEFSLDLDQIILVPGNHDLDRKAGKKAYQLEEREDVEDELKEGLFFDRGPDIVSVRSDEEQYKLRFLNFGGFYRELKSQNGKELFPLDYNRQGTLHFLPKAGLVIAGFNSAWETDHHFKERASINPNAVSHVLNMLRQRKETQGFLKIAVWHHPIQSLFEDRITDTGFLDRLVQAGFTIGLHGHLHKSVSSPYVYEHGPDGRKMHVIGAGTFGALTKEWTPGFPLQYHLLTGRGSELEVLTRHRSELDGPWEPGPIWRQGPGRDPSSRLILPISEMIDKGAVDQKGITDPEPVPLIIPADYLDWLARSCSWMDIEKMRSVNAEINVSLPKVFIPLYALPPNREEEKKAKIENQAAMERQQPEDIEHLILKEPFLVIEGRAGSGKTTLLRHFCHEVANGAMAGGEGLLPILVFMKDIDAPENGLKAFASAFEKVLEEHLNLIACDLSVGIVKEFCNAGRAVLMLDGLDEIDSDLRDWIVESLHDFRERNGRPKVVFAGRPHGISGAVKTRFLDGKVVVNSLIETQVDTFVHNWFCHVPDPKGVTCRTSAEELLTKMRAHEHVDQLKDTPLMLTAICLLWYDEKMLPEQRVELYDKFVTYLLKKRFGNSEREKRFLMKLAFHMHIELRERRIDESPAVDLMRSVYPIKNNETEGDYLDRLRRKFERIEADCGLIKLEKGRYSFWHLSFQAYLAAFALIDQSRDRSEAIEPFWEEEWFGEFIPLYIGLLSLTNNNLEAHDIPRKQLDRDDLAPFIRWRLAASGMEGIHKDWRDEAVMEDARARMLEIMCSEKAPADARADAGEILGRLGDPRDLKAFVAISEGTYRLSMGEVEIEKPFETGKYPVTNEWYREFIDAGGYQNPQWWTPEGRKWLQHTQAQIPEFWHQRKWNNPSAPVVGVCWWEAVAFLNWLTKTRDDGYRYFLPSEIQWEAVAAGKEGKGKYPWRGDWAEDHCNSEEAGLKQTSVVGVFQKGDTPEGVVDLSGNVWEWTESDYHSKSVMNDFPHDKEIQNLYERILNSTGEKQKQLIEEYKDLAADKQRKLPVLRGGSWYYYRVDVARSSRVWNYPVARVINLGFRAARTKS